MRAAICFAAVVLAGGCTPEIGPGTYFCGPELFCPPDLECDPNSFSCEIPGSFAAFSCPEGSETNEPDDDVISTAPGLGRLACNYNGEFGPVCIDDLSDTDLLKFEVGDCAGQNPHVEVEIRYPVAMAPLEVEVLDENEVVVATGEPCTPTSNFSGMDWLCVEMPAVEGTYFIRVRARGDGAGDCDGDCQYNLYKVFVRYPLA